MSTLSDIYNAFRDALTLSRDRYNALYTNCTDNTKDFYSLFMNKLIWQWHEVFSKSNPRRNIISHIERFFKSTEIDFVAIDGTCRKNAASDFIMFFAGAYGAKGRIGLRGEPAKISYEKWELKRDVTMMAQVPVPLAEMADIADPHIEETFLTSERDRINLASIHINLMQLAEIFLAYNVASSSLTDTPKLLLIDQSMSSLMASTAIQPSMVTLQGYPFDRRYIDLFDITIALAHPFNRELEVPSTKKFRQYTAIIAAFHHLNKQIINTKELCDFLNVTEKGLSPGLDYLLKKGFIKKAGYEWHLLHNAKDSWLFTVAFFNRLCTRLFIDKDQSALLYEADDPYAGVKRLRWLSPTDIMFLTAVGLKALIELCWEKNILLVGVVKDSESKYLSRNYFGVMKYVDLYPELKQHKFGPLPWTDRILLETIPIIDQDLEAPWSTIEFDSTFMTLQLREHGSVIRVEGIRGDIVASERLFARSLAQFYLNRKKQTPLMGHVVFLDRLLHPAWDNKMTNTVNLENGIIGKISPFVQKDNQTNNIGQAVMMYFLSTLTRNHFPEVIGYPEPLHKADWGAKTINRRMGRIIESADLPFRNNAIYKTVRTIRDSNYRR